MSEILTCEALTKCYDKDKTALDGIGKNTKNGINNMDMPKPRHIPKI